MKPTDDHMKIINSRLPMPMTSDQVEILPFMVFDQEVTDRYTQATPEFLKKMVKDMNEGRVAMNALHRSQTTLPVGRSVNGSFKDGKAYANMYAVIKNHDGSVPEDGKVLADKYNTGAVFAASAGVKVGFYKCSICGFDIFDYENCKHWPGSMYIVDENKPPQRCIAFMTGHDIQDGTAMDCGCYEVSAVTAGGVADAGLTLDEFSKYDGTDPVEFKKANEKNIKTAFAKQAITMTVAQFEATSERSEPDMKKEDVLAILKEEYGDLPTQYAALEKAKEEISAKYADLEKTFNVLKEEAEGLKTQVAEFEAVKTELEAAKTAMASFKDAYVGVVTADAARAGKTDENLGERSVEDLQAYHKECMELIAALPVGQQTTAAPGTEEFQLDLDNCY